MTGVTSVAALFMFYGNTWSDPRDEGYGQRNNQKSATRQRSEMRLFL